MEKYIHTLHFLGYQNITVYHCGSVWPGTNILVINSFSLSLCLSIRTVVLNNVTVPALFIFTLLARLLYMKKKITIITQINPNTVIISVHLFQLIQFSFVNDDTPKPSPHPSMQPTLRTTLTPQMNLRISPLFTTRFLFWFNLCNHSWSPPLPPTGAVWS